MQSHDIYYWYSKTEIFLYLFFFGGGAAGYYQRPYFCAFQLLENCQAEAGVVLSTSYVLMIRNIGTVDLVIDSTFVLETVLKSVMGPLYEVGTRKYLILKMLLTLYSPFVLLVVVTEMLNKTIQINTMLILWSSSPGVWIRCSNFKWNQCKGKQGDKEIYNVFKQDGNELIKYQNCYTALKLLVNCGDLGLQKFTKTNSLIIHFGFNNYPHRQRKQESMNDKYSIPSSNSWYNPNTYK